MVAMKANSDAFGGPGQYNNRQQIPYNNYNQNFSHHAPYPTQMDCSLPPPPPSLLTPSPSSSPSSSYLPTGSQQTHSPHQTYKYGNDHNSGIETKRSDYSRNDSRRSDNTPSSSYYHNQRQQNSPALQQGQYDTNPSYPKSTYHATSPIGGVDNQNIIRSRGASPSPSTNIQYSQHYQPPYVNTNICSNINVPLDGSASSTSLRHASNSSSTSSSSTLSPGPADRHPYPNSPTFSPSPSPTVTSPYSQSNSHFNRPTSPATRPSSLSSTSSSLSPNGHTLQNQTHVRPQPSPTPYHQRRENFSNPNSYENRSSSPAQASYPNSLQQTYNPQLIPYPTSTNLSGLISPTSPTTPTTPTPSSNFQDGNQLTRSNFSSYQNPSLSPIQRQTSSSSHNSAILPQTSNIHTRQSSNSSTTSSFDFPPPPLTGSASVSPSPSLHNSYDNNKSTLNQNQRSNSPAAMSSRSDLTQNRFTYNNRYNSPQQSQLSNSSNLQPGQSRRYQSSNRSYDREQSDLSRMPRNESPVSSNDIGQLPPPPTSLLTPPSPQLPSSALSSLTLSPTSPNRSSTSSLSPSYNLQPQRQNLLYQGQQDYHTTHQQANVTTSHLGSKEVAGNNPTGLSRSLSPPAPPPLPPHVSMSHSDSLSHGNHYESDIGRHIGYIDDDDVVNDYHQTTPPRVINGSMEDEFTKVSLLFHRFKIEGHISPPYLN